MAECVPKISDDRRYAPATVRNRDLILEILRDVLPMTGVTLEIASGSGGQVVHCARNLPSLVFQPSDPDPDARLSVAAWVKATGVTNVGAPIALDASQSGCRQKACPSSPQIGNSPAETALGSRLPAR